MMQTNMAIQGMACMTTFSRLSLNLAQTKQMYENRLNYRKEARIIGDGHFSFGRNLAYNNL